MKFKKMMPFLPIVLLGLSSIINILYLEKLVPEGAFRIGFLSVMIASIIVNLKNFNGQKKPGFSNQFLKTNKKWHSALLICLLLLWIATYIIATFWK